MHPVAFNQAAIRRRAQCDNRSRVRQLWNGDERANTRQALDMGHGRTRKFSLNYPIILQG